jgi:hypothetical protein
MQFLSLVTITLLLVISCSCRGEGGAEPKSFVYEDLNGDGKVDTLRLKWLGKNVVVVDDGSHFLPRWQREGADPAAKLTEAFTPDAELPIIWNPARAGWGSYLIAADVDGDGKFETDADFYYRALDRNGDLAPEIEYFSASTIVELVANLNGERDFKHLNWRDFAYGNEQRSSHGTRYYQNVHGSGFFHNTRISYPDLSIAWENPIAWYDFNNDGFTDMVMRIANLGWPEKPQVQSKNAHEAELAFELNGELSRDKWHSLDFQLTFTAYGKPGLPLGNFADHIDGLAAPEWARGLFGGNIRRLASNEDFVYLPYMDGYRAATEFAGWTGVWLLWDEDDDDNRWEEMFSRHETTPDANWRGYSDRIGDRVEIDSDFKGGGKLYVGAFDGRIHLYHADKADWNIDYYAHYKGAVDRVNTDEGPEPPAGLLHDVVRYHDTDGNGFIDRIEYGTAEYGREEETWKLTSAVNILDFADKDNPHPDVQPLFDLKTDAKPTGWSLAKWDGEPVMDWSGMPPYEAYRKIKAIYERICAKQWIEARMLYDTASSLGMTSSEKLPECAAPVKLSKAEKANVKDIRVLRGYSSLTDAAGLREKYNNGYWLKEKVFQDIRDSLGPRMSAKIERLYYTGRIRDLCDLLARP